MRVATFLTALVLGSGLLLAIPGTASAGDLPPASQVVTNPAPPAVPEPGSPADQAPVLPGVPVTPIDPPAVAEPALPPAQQPNPSPDPVSTGGPEPSRPPTAVRPSPVPTIIAPTPEAVVPTPPAGDPTPGAVESPSTSPLAPAGTSPHQPAVLDRAVVGEHSGPTTPPPTGGPSQVVPAAPTGSGAAEPGTRADEAVADTRTAASGFSLRYLFAALLGVVALALAVAIGAVSQPRGTRRTH